jgi:hypothetical protein
MPGPDPVSMSILRVFLAPATRHGRGDRLSPKPRRGDARALVIVTSLLAVLAGCQTSKDGSANPTLAAQGRELFGEASRGNAGGAPADEGWSILIQAYSGEGAQADANDGLGRVRSRAGLTDAYVSHRGNAWVIAYGKYPGPRDPKAVADLDRIKHFTYEGTQPFAMAYLTPPMVAGTMPEYDLRNAKKLHGPEALYTLQIGVYGVEGVAQPTPEQMREVRAKAEEAVVVLRRQGEEAYYFHGPTMSVVTIGLFDETDHDLQAAGVNSPRLKKLMEKYPYNLYNGQGIKERHRVATSTGKTTMLERMQPSRVVVVPDS